MSAATSNGANPVLAGAMARLALRQQNLGVLVPVLLHDINGALNGLALSTELLSRLSASPAAPAAASNEGSAAAGAVALLQRTKNELGRLKLSLKDLEHRLLPGVTGMPAPRRAAVAAMLRDVQEVLLPAVRRGQHELRLAEPGEAADAEVALRPEDLFDLVAGLMIVAIEGAPPRSTLEVGTESSAGSLLISVEHGGAAQAGIGNEIHRELLRQAAIHAGGSAEWHQSGSGVRARLRLPLRSY